MAPIPKRLQDKFEGSEYHQVDIISVSPVVYIRARREIFSSERGLGLESWSPRSPGRSCLPCSHGGSGVVPWTPMQRYQFLLEKVWSDCGGLEEIAEFGTGWW